MALTSGAEMPDCDPLRGGGYSYYYVPMGVCYSYMPVVETPYVPVGVCYSYMPVVETPTAPEQPTPPQPTVYPETEEDKKMLKELITLIPDPGEQKKVRDYWTAPGVDSKARKEFYDNQKKQLKEESSRSNQPASAHIIVSLPEDARLFIDGEATTSKSERRVFESPPLPVGRVYYYTLRAEVVRDGKLVSFSQEVTIRAGKIAEVQLTEPAREQVASR
jgi:uncharacterized protein (TIGR03000 family)